MRKQYNTVSFKNQTVFVGIDVHKKQWTVTIRHCGQNQKTFSMDPEPEKLADQAELSGRGISQRLRGGLQRLRGSSGIVQTGCAEHRDQSVGRSDKWEGA